MYANIDGARDNMSFIYAEKTSINMDGEVIPITTIYGDTKNFV